MPLGVVSGFVRGMGVLDGGGHRRRGRGSFGGEFGRPIVTSGNFATRLFSKYFEDLLRFEPPVQYHSVRIGMTKN